MTNEEAAAAVAQAFEACDPLPKAEGALLRHVLMLALSQPELITPELPQRLLNLLGLLRALQPEMLGLLAVALTDLRYVNHFLSGGQPSDFI